MNRIYICDVEKTDITANLRFNIIAKDINDAVDKVKNELNNIIGEQFLKKMIRRFEYKYDLSKTYEKPPYIEITDMSSTRQIDIKYLNDKINELRGREYKKDTNLSNIVKDLILYESYCIEVFFSGCLIQRYENIYYNEYGEVEQFRREKSDYIDEVFNKFEFGSKVRLKNLNNGIVYTITSTPYSTFCSRDWENVYGIKQEGYEDIEDGTGYEIEVHESELEKIEEE